MVTISKDFVFRSGKFSGKTYAEVSEKHPNYIDWVIENRPEMLREHPKSKTDGMTPREKFNALMPNTNFDNEK